MRRITGIKGQIQKRGVERRRAIVQAAMELFSRSGFRGTGIAAIAAQAGVTPSAVLHHFGTKEGLLQAVIEAHDARAVARLAEFKGQGALAALESLVRDAEFSVEEPHLSALYTVLEVENLPADATAHEFFLQRSRMVRVHLARVLSEGIRDGELRPDFDADLKAQEIMAFMEGALLQWLLDPEKIDLVALYRSYVSGLVVQLRKHRK